MQSNYKKTRSNRAHFNKYQSGLASDVIMTLTASILIVLLAIQLTLIFRVKFTLQYAAHEAARIGALNNAAPVSIPMNVTALLGTGAANVQFKRLPNSKKTLTQGLTNIVGGFNHTSVWDGFVAGMMPLFGGSVPDEKKLLIYYVRAYEDLIRSSCITYLNPTQQAFIDWGFAEFNGEDKFLYQIPTDTLRYRKPLAYYEEENRNSSDTAKSSDALLKGAASNKTLAEANVLHLRTYYGYTLSVPIVNVLMLEAYKTFVGTYRSLNAFENAMIDKGKLPLTADGAVGMQTPLLWHPFYSFGPEFGKKYEIPELKFDALLSGPDAIKSELVNLSVKSIVQFIGLGVTNAISAGANQAILGTKELGNGISFCPAIWLPKTLR